MAKKNTKTNAMRMLDREKIKYNMREFETDGNYTAVEVASILGQSADRLFKTLVTEDGNHGNYVFCIPSDEELDLKAAARAAGVKKLEMLKQKDLFKTTGYVHGGCSPVGMKKLFPTYIHSTAEGFDTIYVSAGKVGMQIEIDPADIVKVTGAEYKELIK